MDKLVGGPHIVANRKVFARGIARPTVTSVRCSDYSGRTTVFEFPGRHLGLSPRKLGFNPKPDYMGYTVDKVALGQVFAHYVGFLLSVYFLQPATVYSFIHLPPTIHNPSNSDRL